MNDALLHHRTKNKYVLRTLSKHSEDKNIYKIYEMGLFKLNLRLGFI